MSDQQTAGEFTAVVMVQPCGCKEETLANGTHRRVYRCADHRLVDAVESIARVCTDFRTTQREIATALSGLSSDRRTFLGRPVEEWEQLEEQLEKAAGYERHPTNWQDWKYVRLPDLLRMALDKAAKPVQT